MIRFFFRWWNEAIDFLVFTFCAGYDARKGLNHVPQAFAKQLRSSIDAQFWRTTAIFYFYRGGRVTVGATARMSPNGTDGQTLISFFSFWCKRKEITRTPSHKKKGIEARDKKIKEE
jgi:hypothetical protein